jgi:hypothetical protein
VSSINHDILSIFVSLLGCNAVWVKTWRWRQYFLPKRWCLPTNPTWTDPGSMRFQILTEASMNLTVVWDNVYIWSGRNLLTFHTLMMETSRTSTGLHGTATQKTAIRMLRRKTSIISIRKSISNGELIWELEWIEDYIKICVKETVC